MLAEKNIFIGRNSPQRPPAPIDDEFFDTQNLLEIYLTLPHKQREQRFVDTSAAAAITGLTQRTIQLWIEFGVIRAIPIGRKYKIDTESLIAYLKSRIELQA